MRHRGIKKVLIALLLLIIAFIVYFFCVTVNVIAEICNAEVNARVNNIINESNDIVLGLDVFYKDFFTIIYDENENVNAIIANTGLINQITLIWNTEIQNRLNLLRTLKIELPSGVLTGSALLAQFGVDVSVYAQIISNCAITYKSEFTAAGINQTRHRLVLYTEVYSDITVPVKAKDVIVSQEIILAESIITGIVPSTYLIDSSSGAYLDLLP